MKLSLGRAAKISLLIGIVAFGGAAACEPEATVTPPPEDDDAGTTPVPTPKDEEEPDSGAPFLEEDAGVDADVDVGPRTCSDHGFCWTPFPDDKTITGLWGDGTGIMWAVTEQGAVLRWDGSAWTEHASGFGRLNAIWGSGPTDIWIGGTNGLRRGTGETSDALTFESFSLPSPARPPPILGIWGASADEVWAVASAQYASVGYVYRFVGDGDGGGEWELDPISSNGVVYTHVWGGHDTVWLGGSRYSDETFANQSMVVYKTAESDDFKVLALADNPDPEVYAWEKYNFFVGGVVSSKTSVTFFGQPEALFGKAAVWHGTSSDDGETFQFSWSQDPRSDRPKIHAAAGTSANDVWAVGDYGRFVHWDGTAWSTVAISIDGHPVPNPLYAVWTSGPSDIWAGGKGMALRFDPAAKNGGAK